MNEAILGKQTWKIITKPQTLVASILLPKYYNKEQFTKVKPKADNSQIWKSLLTGRVMVLKGIDVQVWSGLQTSILNGSLKKHDIESINNDINIRKIMCPLTHNCKRTTQAQNQLNNENHKFLHQRTYSILGGQDNMEVQLKW